MTKTTYIVQNSHIDREDWSSRPNWNREFRSLEEARSFVHQELLFFFRNCLSVRYRIVEQVERVLDDETVVIKDGQEQLG